jgi:ABC-type transport system involved in multi-copper enzyme maturation permease subunit
MNLRPVIERELICEARNPANYLLRVIAAAALLFTGGLYLLEDAAVNQQWQGFLLFQRMNLVILLTIFVLVPILAADAIAREKREGTLGLLFLTPLKAREIVIGKCLIHGLRSLTVLIATAPMLALPVMMGGVSASQLLSTIAYDLSALCVALAAGIHASVRQTEWFRAVGAALLMSFGLSFLFWTCAIPIQRLTYQAAPVVPLVVSALWLFFGPLILWRFIETSARWLATNWSRELTRSPEPQWVSLFANSPFWRGVFRWNKSRALDRNPVAWLQERSWTGRLTKWGWLLLVLASIPLGGCLGSWNMDYTSWLNGLGLLLVAGIAFTATSTFRQERETGALELLLITPLTAGQILRGRLWGMVAHFLPATLLLGFFWFVPAWFSTRLPAAIWLNCWFGFSTLATIPLVGFWFALRRWHPVTAWLLTLLVGYLLPLAGVFALRIMFGSGSTFSLLAGLIGFTGCQLAVAALCFRQVHRALETRSFVTG